MSAFSQSLANFPLEMKKMSTPKTRSQKKKKKRSQRQDSEKGSPGEAGLNQNHLYTPEAKFNPEGIRSSLKGVFGGYETT